MSERLPNGGAPALMLWYSPAMKSYPIAYDERTARRPSPCTSHATPARGDEVPPLLVQPGLPGREARVARIDESRRRVEEHLAPDVLVEVRLVEDHDRVVARRIWPKYGSHRTPALTVTRLDTRHVSCP